MIAHLVGLAWALGAAGLLAIAALGAGGWCERGWREVEGLGKHERLALRLVAGLGWIGLAVFLLGQIHFSAGVSAAVLAGAALLNLRFPITRVPFRPMSWTLLYAAVVVILCMVAGLDRPVGDVNFDQITYHLLGPVVWQREGRITPVLEESLTAFPATVEVLFAVVRSVSNDRAPGLVGALFFVAILGQIWGLARSLGATAAGAGLAVALFAGMPAVTATIESCFVDLPYAAFVLAAGRLAFAGSRPGHFALAGMFAGFAAGTKYFALPMIGLLAFLVFIRREHASVGRWRRVTFLLASAALAGGAWYLRNWLVLENPIYPPPPGLWRLLPTPTFPLEASEGLLAYMRERGVGLGRGFDDLLWLPFRLTYRTAWFHGGGGIGLGLLAFTPIGLFLAWRVKGALAWAGLATGLTLAWFYSSQELRFLDAALAVFSAFAGLAGAILLERRGVNRWLATGIVAISLGLGAWLAVQSRLDRLRALSSPARSEARYREGMPHFGAFAFLNSQPEVRKVWITHPNVPAYFLEKDYTVQRGRYGELPHAGVDLGPDPVTATGCTHVFDVDYYGTGFRFQPSDRATLVYAEGNARLYRIGSPGAP